MGLVRAFFNGALATWICSFLLLAVERIRSIIVWSFLMIDSYQAASKFILMGPLKLFQQQISFLIVSGIIFLFFGSFLVGIRSQTVKEAGLGFIFFLIVLIFFTLMNFSILLLFSNPLKVSETISGTFFLLSFPLDLMAFPLAFLGVRLTSSEEE